MRKPHKRARNLRKTMPEAERRLWVRLRNRQLGDFRFRRQHSIGPYIADFACIEAMLVIECDGEQHGFDAFRAHDAKRDAFLESEGWTVLRFWNREIHDNMDGVLETIHDAARKSVLFLRSKPDESGDEN
ncbi:endonuclease domain-containing protein [Hyphococcus luteus]|uniref:endonuclease domain-containing protein n=1 Tax=Hyphococcus luteus TaxID=2058213 RepID=UPI003C6D4AA5